MPGCWVHLGCTGLHLTGYYPQATAPRPAPLTLPGYKRQVLWWWSHHHDPPCYHTLPSGSCWHLLLPDIKSFTKESALLWGENTALLTCWSLWSVNKQMDKGTQWPELDFSKSLWQSPTLKVGLKRLNWHRIREKVLLQIQGCLKE